MDAFKPLCQVWHEQVKQFFTKLHGHQSKVLAMFVLGAIKAESIVIQKVAEALLAESEAKAPSIERRLERFLSNERIETEKRWHHLFQKVIQRIFRLNTLIDEETLQTPLNTERCAFTA